MNGIQWRNNYASAGLPVDENLSGFVVMGMCVETLQDGLDTHNTGLVEPLYVTDCAEYALEFKQKIESHTTYKCYIVRCPMYIAPKSAIFECM